MIIIGLIDLTGRRFGRLIVLKRAENKGKQVAWLCKCDCGKETIVFGSCLRGNVTKSCGCLQKEITSKSNFRDITNKKFGRLTAISLYGQDKHGHRLWNCKCDCGNDFICAGYRLTNGDTKSCGCYKIEKIIEASKKYNEYKINEDFGIGITSNTNKEFYFDLDDYDKIKDYCWYENDQGYILTSINQKHIRFHRFILDSNKNITIDHINRNRADNRKENLRNCSQQENMRNQSIRSDNKSGCIGVSTDKCKRKWRVRIKIDGKEKVIGRFINLEDAIIARLKAEKLYFGEFAPQRHLFEQYNI